MSYGFALRPNPEGTPFGRAGYGYLHVVGDRFVFSASDGKAHRGEERMPIRDPEPIQLTPLQWQQVERRIAEFIGDSSSLYAYAFGAIARLNGLPLYFDWTAFMALLPDGSIVWVPYDDEPGDIELVQEERVRNLGLFQATKLHPELQFLVPLKPPDALDCPDCRGTGRLPFPPGSEHIAERLVCYCGGIGWLPPVKQQAK
jgi:hypothetical protein